MSSHRFPRPPQLAWPLWNRAPSEHTESTKTRDTEGERAWRTRSLERSSSWGGEQAACRGPRLCPLKAAGVPKHLLAAHVGLLPWPGILPAAASRAACPVPSLEKEAQIGYHLPETETMELCSDHFTVAWGPRTSMCVCFGVGREGE